jgi:ATP-binding cassette subfamily B (MDR/TAP) protein 1
VAEGGTLAEEVISTIRTAQAFGTQSALAKLYGVYVEKSRKMDLKAATWQGGGLSVFFFVIYAAYGLGSSAPLFSGMSDSRILF